MIPCFLVGDSISITYVAILRLTDDVSQDEPRAPPLPPFRVTLETCNLQPPVKHPKHLRETAGRATATTTVNIHARIPRSS